MKLCKVQGTNITQPVWAAMFACRMVRKVNKYKNVATGLFQDVFDTCIDLNDSNLYNYFNKATSLLTTVANGQINFTISQRSNIRAFV